MKKRLKTLGALSIIVLVLVIAGCNLEKKSKTERVSEFLSDLSANDWTSLYVHIHPDNSFRNQAKSKDTWTPSPFADPSTFSYGGLSDSGSNTITVTVTVTGNAAYSGPWVFTMKEDTKDLWYINRLTADGNPVIP